ncbi:hypothetical protein RB608_25350 [Nocardioides sp. LHD-245]|uniref:hypothetical protein n=1 Tax=Nocardioides sp. LHD-245 TaxID=3051387 RepID=UPI0027DF7644|nr:hypothetical protein [Nocardioides sp. LHD-245]
MHSRHLTLGSLALVAVLGTGSGLLTPAAAAAAVPAAPSPLGDTRECGRPEIPAQWGSVEHPAVLRTVDAITRPAWRWQRPVGTIEREYARESVAAVVLVHWTRTVVAVEREHAWTVVDRPARPGSSEEGHVETRVVAPAVVEEQWEYVQQQTGRTRWEHEGWNAGGDGEGWSPTGRTRSVETTPAVTEDVWVVDRAAVPAEPEVSHVETAWFADGTTPHAGALPTGHTRDVPSGVEETDLPVGEQPTGVGWVEGATAEISAAEEERIWLPDGAEPEPGLVATGATRAGASRLESTDATSVAPPAGDGWTELPGSAVDVVVVAAGEVVVEPGWVEDFVLVPGEPATPPCAEPAVPTGLPVVVLRTSVVVPDGAVAPATATSPATGPGRVPWAAVVPGSALPASGA